MKRLFVLASFAFTAVLFFFGSGLAHAAPFNSSNLIDDSVFSDYTTMSAGQIDAFLNSFPNSCISPNSGFLALNPTGYNPNSGYSYGGYVTAGQVIYDAAQAYSINPQVILTTLQKEQSLVQGGTNFCENGDMNKYAAAVGYGCPDSGTTYSYTGVSLYQRNGIVASNTGSTCVNSVSKAGFSQQVIRGAWLLKFGQQRSEGNINWAVIKGSWDNSDDPQTCYGGPMTQGNYQRCPSGSIVSYDGYTTIDSTSVHMDNGATAALYWYTPHFHGNQSFDDIFQSWFGSLIGSDVVRSVNNPTVYLISGDNKYPIGDINVMGDFSTLGQLRYVSDAYLANYTTGSLLGHMVGDSSGTLYFIASGIKLPFTTCQAVTDYGYSCGSVITLSSFQINKFVTGPAITPVYKTTNGKTFYISGGQKHEAFDQQALTANGITAGANVLLEQSISYLPYGTPVTRNGVVVTDRGTGAHYLFDSSKYWSLAGDLYGLSAVNNLTHDQQDDASIPSGQRLTGFTGFISDTGSTTQYALVDTGKAQLSSPSSWSSSYVPLSSTTLSSIANSSVQINSQLVKSASDPSVYYVTAGTKRPLPSWQDLVNLHVTPFVINGVPDTLLNSIASGPVIFSSGQLVKAANSPTVYVVKSPTELYPIASFAYPQDLGVDMSSLLTISSNDLTKYSVLSLLQTKIVCSGTYYVGTLGQLYSMNSTQLTQYGFATGSFLDGSSACLNAPVSSKQLGNFIRVSNGTIYLVSGGQKQAFTNYGAYLAHGGTAQNTVSVSDYFASLVANGTNITQ